MGVERLERFCYPIDEKTQTFLEYFAAVNWGGKIEVPGYGTLKEPVVTAAISWGVKTGEVEFVWLEENIKNEKEFGIRLVETEKGKHVVAILESNLNKRIESGVQKYLPGGVIPYIMDTISYIAAGIKKRGGLSTDVTKEATEIIVEIYRLYRQI